MKNYYRRKGVKKALLNFVFSGSKDPIREGAFFNENIDGIQRHVSKEREESVLVLDSERKLNRLLKSGATAFYSSYWRYSDPFRAENPIGRDLAWTVRASDGGIMAAKDMAGLFLETLEREGFPAPFLKYSGKLGFDFLIPLEDVQSSAPEDLGFMSKIQEDLTESFLSLLVRKDGYEVEREGAKALIKSGQGTCLLTELKWKRGLLLSPMSLHPGSGLVSLPLSSSEIPEFSVLDASPEDVSPRCWTVGESLPGKRNDFCLRYSAGKVPFQA